LPGNLLSTKEAFFEDMETLQIKRADEFPAATDQLYIDK
jgi:hypothetical protein